MIDSLYALILMIGITIITITLLFLPSVIELRKPKDAGPRKIFDSLTSKRLSPIHALIDIEEESDESLARFFVFIPNLESYSLLEQ